MGVLRTKSIEQSMRDADDPEYQLKKSLTAVDLTVFGIGVIIGAGIFTLTGAAAHDYAGPAVAVSFAIAASAAPSPLSATPSSRQPCRSPGRPTRSRTRRSASWSRGSSAGT